MVRKHLLPALALGLLAITAQPGQAYIPPDDHYLCDFIMPLEFFMRSRWLPEELPLKVYLPAPPAGTPANHTALVKQAFAEWARILPQFQPQFVTKPADAQLKANWVRVFPESEGEWGLAVYPGAVLIPGPSLKHSGQMFLPLRPSVSELPYDSETFLNLARHAVGHALGLPHSRNRDDVMSAYLFTLPDISGISARDASSLRALYTLPARLEMPPCNGG